MTVSISLILVAAAAQAQVPAIAKVEWANRPQPMVIVDEKAWPCDGNSCSGQIVDRPFLKLRACRAIARYAGKVTSFATETGPMSESELARCNGERR